MNPELLEEYVGGYMNVVREAYPSLVELGDNKLHASVYSEFLDEKEVEVKLLDAITKHFDIKKVEAKKILEMEVL